MRIVKKKSLKGQVICFTGKSKYTRQVMHRLAIKNGGKVCGQISGKTTLLVMGERPGSKLDRAFDRRLPVMMDVEFLDLVE